MITNIKDTRGGKNRIVNNNPFECMSKEAQYWIGFLAADGNLSTKKYSISMQLKDIDHILKYRDFISPKLKPYDHINKARSLMRTVLFGNFEIYHFLLNLGITPKKSKTLELKTPITKDIIRGVFDGDGSISQNRPKITTGSVKFKNQIELHFDKIGIDYTTTVKHKIKCPYIFDITVLQNSREAFFNYMYYKNCIKLEKKYKLYRAVVEKSTIKNIG